MICERCAREVAEATPEARPDLASLDLMTLPFVPVAEYLNIPRIAAVYFALAPPKICYIGIAQDLAQRWRHHPQLLRLQAEPGARIAWLPQGDKVRRGEIEVEAIRHFKPLWNRGGDEYMSPWALIERFPRPRWGDIAFPPVIEGVHESV